MLPSQVSFLAPIFLALILLLPALWWFSFRCLAGLGRLRRWMALLLRTLVIVLLVVALAQLLVVQRNDHLTVIYLLDQSWSIPAAERQAMIQKVRENVRAQRRDKDRAGVIIFGRDAVIELPPFDDDLQMGGSIESLFDPHATNIAAAMKLAQATFPEDAARRIVLVTDGNQNQGNAMEQARALAASGIGIDVVPVRYHKRGDVAVERVIVPSEVRLDQPFDLRIVLSNDCDPKLGDKGAVTGRLRITRTDNRRFQKAAPPVKATPPGKDATPGHTAVAPGGAPGTPGPRPGLDEGQSEQTEESVTLRPGKTVLTRPQTIGQTDFYTFEATFIPDRRGNDVTTENKHATAFTHVAGKGRVLLIVNKEKEGGEDYEALAQLLRKPAGTQYPGSRDEKKGLEVDVCNIAVDNLFSSLAELQVYDTVVLADVPRSMNEKVSFSDEQIELLVRNTQQMGAGLVMLGGPESFGAGGWTGTELEKAMPVDFEIKNAEVIPCGALVLVMHASEIAQGNGIQKQIAKEAIKTLNAHDYCGVMQWNGNEVWIHGQGPVEIGGGERNKLLAAVDRMVPGDMPDFEPAMLLAEQGFLGLQNNAKNNNKPKPAVMHMIVISDGDPGPPKQATLARLKAMGVTISTVAVDAHGTAESQNLANIASQGAPGGKYYSVSNSQNPNKALPRIFQKEARRVSRSLIYEAEAFPVEQTTVHEMLSGIKVKNLPNIKGYVLTTKKANPLVETVLRATKPGGDDNTTILASWNYGLGHVVAFTTDPALRWTPDWRGNPACDKLLRQIVHWSMRPAGESGHLTAAFEPQEAKMRVVVTALDDKNQFLNFLTMTGTAVGPDLKKPLDLEIEQMGPGRYVGTFPIREAGSYFVTINPGRGMAPLRTGVNVPYSDEFRDREANEALLSELALVQPKDGPSGQLIEFGNLPASNTFRHDLPKAVNSQPVWYWLLLLASCVFLCDVFVRRVNVNFDWLPPLLARCRDLVLRRQPAMAQPQYIERLKSRKAEVTGHLDQLRAATRFELPTQAPIELKPLDELAPPTPAAPHPAGPSLSPEKKEEETYTERLLKAKKKAWEERKE